MTLLAVLGGLLLALALIAREVQLARERSSQATNTAKLHSTLTDTRRQLRRALEDIYVLHAVLADKNLVDDADVARIRARLIDTPRRVAEERDAIMRSHDVSPPQLVIDEDVNKIH